MTTAHRPTWKAAVGRAQEGGWSAGGAPSAASSVLDVASHTRLKLRAGSQVVPEDKKALLQASLAKLEAAERRGGGAGGLKRGAVVAGGGLIKQEVEEEGRRRLLKQTADVDDVGIKSKYDDADDSDDGKDNDGGGGGWSDLDDDNPAGGGGNDDDSDLDASDSDNDDNSDDDSDDEDEEAALQAELAKIRAEREAAKMREEAEAAAEEEARMEEAALTGNPLLSGEGSSSGRMKRKWNDDVVFRNQAKNEPDQSRKRFINDTVRNDFHKRFLNKFIR